MNPVDVPIGTPYGRRGPYWSCNEDAAGNGIHTGVDYPAGVGTKVVAARPGKVVYCNHGSAFGNHQLEILPGDGTRDFYAHMRSRAVGNGAHVEVGQKVGEVGSEGNVTGPHLHFERHKVATGGWSCSVVVDPQPSINYQGSQPKPPPEEDMPKYVRVSTSKDRAFAANSDWHNIEWDDIKSGDDVVDKGYAYVKIEDKMFTATLTVTAETGSEVVRTRFVEKTKKGDDWVDAEEYPNLESPATSGGTYVVDSRTQKCNSERLVAQVNLGEKGGTLLGASLNLLYF